MSVYNLIKYSDSYSKTSGRFMIYHRALASFNNEVPNNSATSNSESFNFEIKLQEVHQLMKLHKMLKSQYH